MSSDVVQGSSHESWYLEEHHRDVHRQWAIRSDGQRMAHSLCSVFSWEASSRWLMVVSHSLRLWGIRRRGQSYKIFQSQGAKVQLMAFLHSKRVTRIDED